MITLLSGCRNTEIKVENPTDTEDTTINDSASSTDSLDTTEVDTTEADTIDINTQVPDTTESEPGYRYMDFIGWEYPDNVSAKTYFYSSDLLFEEGDTVAVDKLINYFIHFEMINPNTHELYDYLIQYKTHADADNYSQKYEICIPKEIVNSVIEKHFAVKVDGSDSQYTHPEKDDCYLLIPNAMGGLSVSMRDYEVSGTRSTAVYALYDSIDKRIFSEVEICIENENSEDDFKIVYVREHTGDGSVPSDETTE